MASSPRTVPPARWRCGAPRVRPWACWRCRHPLHSSFSPPLAAGKCNGFRSILGWHRPCNAPAGNGDSAAACSCRQSGRARGAANHSCHQRLAHACCACSDSLHACMLITSGGMHVPCPAFFAGSQSAAPSWASLLFSRFLQVLDTHQQPFCHLGVHGQQQHRFCHRPAGVAARSRKTRCCAQVRALQQLSPWIAHAVRPCLLPGPLCCGSPTTTVALLLAHTSS